MKIVRMGALAVLIAGAAACSSPTEPCPGGCGDREPTPTVFSSTKSFSTAEVGVKVRCENGTEVTVRVRGEATASATGATQAEADAKALAEAERLANIDLATKMKVDVEVVCRGVPPPTNPPAPPAPPAPPQPTAPTCEARVNSVLVGTQVTFDAKGGDGTYTWYIGNNQVGSGASYTAVPNSVGTYAVTVRSANMTNSCSVQVTQAPPPPTPTCSYSVTTDPINVDYRGGNGAVAVGASPSNCPWTISSNAPWVRVSTSSGSGNGSSGVVIDENPGAARSAQITVTGQNGFVRTITVNQSARPSGPACTYSVTTDPMNVDGRGGEGTVIIGASHSSCTWGVSTSAFWIGASPSSGSGNGSSKITIGGNTGGARTGSITVVGLNGFSKTIPVNQAAR